MSASLQPGTTLGRYTLVQRLGRGGMGEVYEAVLTGPQGFRKPVALKLLAPDRAPTDEDREALFHEARLGALLSHPNLVAIHELGQHEGRWFVSMELVRGASLGELVRDGSLAPAEVVEVGLQVASALAHVHALRVEGRPAGLVHRDVKTANVLVDRTGLVKLADLGIAALAGTGALAAGTPGYMPPEQLDGREDARADLFALGVVLYRIASGRLPFGSGPEALVRVRRADALMREGAFFEPVQEIEGLAEVLVRCLAADPAARWASADDLGAALERLRARLPAGPPLAHRMGADRTLHTPTGASSGQPTVLLAPASLPRRLDRFVGRTEEVRQLSRLCASEPLVTVLGPGGVGKTRLTLEVATRQRQDRVGGAWFCDLAEARSTAGLCAAVAAALSVPLRGEDPVSRVGHAIAGRGPVLVVLDNLEQVIEDAAPVVQTWLSLAPQAVFLCSSQIPMRIPGEQTLALGPLDVAEAADLFQARATRPVPASERPVVEALVARLDGLPLAIELAAARLRVMGLPELLARLEQRFQVLAGGSSARPARHRSLRASLDASWELLPPWGQAALSQLSVFHDGFTLRAAEAVLELTAWPDAPWTLDALATLVDHSLLRFDPDDDRFRLLVAVQDYAALKLSDAERAAAETRHGHWFAQHGTWDARQALSRHGGLERNTALQRDLENLVVATRRAIRDGDATRAAPCALGAWSVLSLVGPVAAALELLDATTGVPGIERVAELQHARGRALQIVGRGTEALPELRRAAQLAERTGHPVTADAKGAVVMALLDLGGLDEARGLALEVVQSTRASGDRHLLGGALSRLGGLHRVCGELDDARGRFEEAVPLLLEAGDLRSAGIAMGNLAVSYKLLGRTDEAVVMFERALATDRAVGDRRNEASVLGNIGALHMDLGRYDEAQRFFTEALTLHREVGNRHDEGIVLGNRALIDMMHERYDAAEQGLLRSIDIERDAGDPVIATIFEANLGALYRVAGRPEDALRVLQEALGHAQALGDLRLLGFTEGELGQLHLQQGRLDQAQQLLTDAEAHLRESGDSVELGKLLTNQIELLLAQGSPEQARAKLAEAEALAAVAGVEATSALGQRLDEVRPLLSER